MPRCVLDVSRSIPPAQRSENGCCRSVARRLSGSSEGTKMNEKPSDPSSLTRQGMDYGETADVQEVHAAIQREKREPRAGLEPLSIWLIAVYGLAIFFGGAYLGRFSGSFSGDSLDPVVIPHVNKQGPSGPGGGPTQELSQADRGKKIFSAN